MSRKPTLSMGTLGTLMAALALAGPTAGIAPKDPHRRAFAEALRGAPKKAKPKEPDAGRWRRHRNNPRRADRRAWGRHFLALMGQPMSSRTWRHFRKAMGRGALKNTGCLAGRFIVKAGAEAAAA